MGLLGKTLEISMPWLLGIMFFMYLLGFFSALWIIGSRRGN